MIRGEFEPLDLLPVERERERERIRKSSTGISIVNSTGEWLELSLKRKVSLGRRKVSLEVSVEKFRTFAHRFVVHSDWSSDSHH